MTTLFANNASAPIASSITTLSTTITVSSGQGAEFPAITGSDYFIATLVDTSNNVEIVKVTARSVDVMTVVRAQEGTTARAYAAGSLIELRMTAAVLTNFAQLAGDQTFSGVKTFTSTIVGNISGNAATATAALTASRASSNSFYTDGSGTENDIGVQLTGYASAYLYNSTASWGLYSPAGGTILSYTRSTGAVNFNGNATTATSATSATNATNANNLTGVATLAGYSISGVDITFAAGGGPIVTGQGGGAAMQSFLRPGSYAVNFGLDTDNVLKVGGWSMGTNKYPIVLSGAGGTYSLNITGGAGYATSANTANSISSAGGLNNMRTNAIGSIIVGFLDVIYGNGPYTYDTLIAGTSIYTTYNVTVGAYNGCTGLYNPQYYYTTCPGTWRWLGGDYTSSVFVRVA